MFEIKLNHDALKEQDRQTYEELFRDNSYNVSKKDIKGKNVLDIGANIGFFTALCAGYHAEKIVAVEPLPSIYSGLVKNVSHIPFVKTMNYAIWHTGDLTLKMENKNVASHISDKGEDVKTVTLKSLLSEFPDHDDNIVLKIDVEGAEHDVLMNVDKETMQRFSIVFIEIHGDSASSYHGVAPLKDRMKELNFKEVYTCPMMFFDGWDAEGNRVNEHPMNQCVSKFVRIGAQLDVTVLASISTRGRYDTTLPMAINAIIMQTRKPDRIVIYDDNDEPKDIRDIPILQYLLCILYDKGMEYELVWGAKKGQHYNHQLANKLGYDFVWRVDDDCVPEPDVLQKLLAVMTDEVGAVGGSCIVPPTPLGEGFGSIEDIFKPNKQWYIIKQTEEVDHLHCSFLYRAGIADYNLNLSRVAHREETLFTYSLKQKGYKILVTPCITWHLRSNRGGIRDGDAELFAHDEKIFQSVVKLPKMVVLDCGLGDHFIFKNILPEIKAKYGKVIIASCYPEVFEGEYQISIADAKMMLGDIKRYNPYEMGAIWKCKGPFVQVFRRIYDIDSPVL